MKNKIPEEDIHKIIESRHNEPHTVLGPHYLEKERAVVIRAFLPHAKRVYVLQKGAAKQKMKRIHI